MSNRVSVCLFRVGNCRWGMEMEGMRAVAEATAHPDPALRVINLMTLLDALHPALLPENIAASREFSPPDEPKVTRHYLIVQPPRQEEVALAVNAVDTIIEIPITAIRPLPLILEQANPRPPVWALAIVEEQLVPLLDVERLVGNAVA